MKKPIPSARIWPHISRDLATLAGERLEDDESYEGISVTRRDWSHMTFSGVRLQGSVLEGVDLSGANMFKAKLSDCRFKEASLAASRGEVATLGRVEMMGCRASGFTLLEGELGDVRFRECQLDLVQLRFAKLPRVALERCSMREADFFGAAMADGICASCDPSGADLSQAKVSNLNLRMSSIHGIKPGWRPVRCDHGAGAFTLSRAPVGDRFQ